MLVDDVFKDRVNNVVQTVVIKVAQVILVDSIETRSDINRFLVKLVSVATQVKIQEVISVLALFITEVELALVLKENNDVPNLDSAKIQRHGTERCELAESFNHL